MCDYRAATRLTQTGGPASPTAAVSILAKPRRRSEADAVAVFGTFMARQPKSARLISGFSLALDIAVSLGVFGIFADVFTSFVDGDRDKNGAAAA